MNDSTTFAILLGFVVILVLGGFSISFMSAYLRDVRKIPPDTPDLRGLDSRRPNVSLWIRRLRRDRKDIPEDVVALGRALVRNTKWLAIVVAVIAAIGLGVAFIIWGVSTVWGALSAAPGWAIIIIVLLFAILLK